MCSRPSNLSEYFRVRKIFSDQKFRLDNVRGNEALIASDASRRFEITWTAYVVTASAVCQWNNCYLLTDAVLRWYFIMTVIPRRTINNIPRESVFPITDKWFLMRSIQNKRTFKTNVLKICLLISVEFKAQNSHDCNHLRHQSI